MRTSLGKPKWLAPAVADAIPYLKDLAPVGLFQVRDPDEFRRRYCERLGRIGVERIERRFHELIDANDGKPLVLLCFERHRQDCHRGDFAAWWEERTGEVVPEFHASLLTPEPPVDPQGCLPL